MTIDSVRAAHQITEIQYSGYFQNNVRKLQEAGKVAEVSEEARVSKILEEDRKKVQPIYESRGKIIRHYEVGKRIDILV